MRNRLRRRADPLLRRLLRVTLTTYLVFGDESRLSIDDTALVANALFNTQSGDITVSKDVFFGHNVSVITGTHDYRQTGRKRAGAIPRSGRNIVIDDGAWVASNATVLGPCRIGAHAVVAAGALVRENVPPYAIVAGVPAKVVGYTTDD